MKIGRIVIGITIVSFIATLIVFPKLPGSIPIHWDIDGSVQTANKAVVFLTALLPVVIYYLKIFTSKIDPKSEAYEKHQKAFEISILTVTLLVTAIHWSGIFYSLGYKIDVRFVAKLLVGIAFIILGNYMGQIRQNYFFGIKNPWTYASEEVWKKTHRASGYIFILAGVIIFGCALIPGMLSAVIIITVIFATIAFNLIYSFLNYKKISKGNA